VRQADRENPSSLTVCPTPCGSTAYRKRASSKKTSPSTNAPAGTLQRMAVYFYLDSGNAQATNQAVMAFTHDDVYKAYAAHLPVMVSHFHFHMNEALTDARHHRLRAVVDSHLQVGWHQYRRAVRFPRRFAPHRHRQDPSGGAASLLRRGRPLLSIAIS